MSDHTNAFARVYGAEHSNPLDVLELALADARALGHHQWADKLSRALADTADLVKVAERAVPLVDAYRRVSGGDGDITASNLRHLLPLFGALS